MSLIYNAIKCKACGDVIESIYTHDFKWCKCGKVAVDGGLSYTKMTGNFNDLEILSLNDNEPFEKIRKFAFKLKLCMFDMKSNLSPLRLKDIPTDELETDIVDRIEKSKQLSYSNNDEHTVLLIKEHQYRNLNLEGL